MTLQLHLFGGIRLTREDGDPVRIASRKSRALLAYLAVCPNRSCARDGLMAILWGDCPEEQARQSLRKELSRLRISLGDRDGKGIVTEADWIHLEPDFLTLDVDQFRRRAESFKVQELELARALYAGEFLEGFHLSEEHFEEWMREQRQAFLDEALAILIRLARLYTERNDLDAGIRVLRHALRLDPFRDDVLRQLLHLLAAAGRNAGLEAAYRDHIERLRLELAAEPDKETIHLYQALGGKSSAPVAANMISPFGLVAEGNSISIEVRGFVGSSCRQRDAAAVNEVAAELDRFACLTVVPVEGGAATKPTAMTRYLVQGEVDCRDGRHRCLVSLRDNITGQLRWAGRIGSPDCDAAGSHELLARKTAAQLLPAIFEAEMSRVSRMPESLLQASELATLAKKFIRTGSRTGLSAQLMHGLELAERAAAMDDNCVGAMAALNWGQTFWHMMRWSDGQRLIQNGRQALDQLLVLRPNSHLTHMRLGWQAYVDGDHASALNSLNYARFLNPNDSCCTAMLSFVETSSGRPDKGEALAREAIDLHPKHPEGSILYNALQSALRHQGKSLEAIKWGERAIAIAPKDPAAKMVLMTCYADAGMAERAGTAYQDLQRRTPAYLASLHSGERRIFRDPAANDRFVAALDWARHSARRQ